MSEKKLGKFVLLARKTGVAQSLDGALHYTDCDECEKDWWCDEHPDKPKSKSKLTTVDEVIKAYYVEPMKKAWKKQSGVATAILAEAAEFGKMDTEKTGVDSIIGAKIDSDEPGCSLYQKAKLEMAAKGKGVGPAPKYEVVWNPVKGKWEPVVKWTKLENQMAYQALTKGGHYVIVGAEKFVNGPPV